MSAPHYLDDQRLAEVLGERVSRCRTALALSQSDLARRSGLPQSQVSRLERGHISTPSLAALLRIAEALEVPADLFVRVDGAPLSEHLAGWSSPSLAREAGASELARLSGPAHSVLCEWWREGRRLLISGSGALELAAGLQRLELECAVVVEGSESLPGALGVEAGEMRAQLAHLGGSAQRLLLVSQQPPPEALESLPGALIIPVEEGMEETLNRIPGPLRQRCQLALSSGEAGLDSVFQVLTDDEGGAHLHSLWEREEGELRASGSPLSSVWSLPE